MLHYKSCYCTCLCRGWGESNAPHNNRLIWSSFAGPLPGAFVYFEPWTTHNNARRTVLLSVCNRQHVILYRILHLTVPEQRQQQSTIPCHSIHPPVWTEKQRQIVAFPVMSLFVHDCWPIFSHFRVMLAFLLSFSALKYLLSKPLCRSALRANNIRTVGCSCAKDWSVRECVCVSFFADYNNEQCLCH